jgi:hypothetical protein
VQIAIKAVLNYSDPIRSPTGSDLVPQDAVTDPMPGHSENYYTYGLVRYLHGGKSGMNVDARDCTLCASQATSPASRSSRSRRGSTVPTAAPCLGHRLERDRPWRDGRLAG